MPERPILTRLLQKLNLKANKQKKLYQKRYSFFYNILHRMSGNFCSQIFKKIQAIITVVKSEISNDRPKQLIDAVISIL